MKLTYLLILLVFNIPLVYAGGKAEGKVADASAGKPLSSANIIIEQTGRGATTDRDGMFSISLPAGQYRVTARFMGYKPLTLEAVISDNETTTLNFQLEPTAFQSEEIVVTATKTERQVIDVPARVQMVTTSAMKSMPVFSADDALVQVSGLNVSRTAGILSSKSTVSLRGMGSDQGRTLILLDGVPVNKTDGGTVNWNYINPSSIEKIEVSKGAGSSLYGGNAMGGVIQMFSKRPSKLFSGTVTNEYGSFNSIGSRGYFTSAYKDWTFKLNGLYRVSDGYIADTNVVDTSYNKVKSDLTEHLIGGAAGYRFSEDHSVELSTQYYQGVRGTGKQYDQGTKKGTRTNYANTLHSIRYHGRLNTWTWSLSGFALHETYDDRNESVSRGTYRRYDVDSKRDDRGLNALMSRPLGNQHTLTGGFEFKHGAVDAVDDYTTSSDAVINKGKMNTASVYIQDEWALAQNRVRITGSLRYDRANFYDGVFRLDSATSVTSFMLNYQDTMTDHSWREISPKIAVQYSPGPMFRIFALYGHGFRPPILDDMCRSGRFSKGFKIVNPSLKPEKIQNYEFGFDLRPGDPLMASASVYHSIGDDYINYISTGDSIAYSSTNRRPIFRKDNISRVNITGFEFDLSVQAHRYVSLFANYTNVNTKIVKYIVRNPAVDADLNGKELPDVPDQQFTAGTNLRYKGLGFHGVYRYRGRQWYDELNTQRVKGYSMVDLKASATYHDRYTVAFSVQNLFGKKIVDNKGVPSPGTIVFGELTVSY